MASLGRILTVSQNEHHSVELGVEPLAHGGNGGQETVTPLSILGLANALQHFLLV